MMEPWEKLRTRKLARFRPPPGFDLRPELVPLVGEVAEWQCATYQDVPEFPHFGQHLWNTADERWLSLAVPDEYLEDP